MLVRRILPALACALLSQAALAIPTTLDAGQVTVDFDADLFNFGIDYYDYGYTSYIDPNSLGYSASSNGVKIDFGNQMALYDYATNESDPLLPVHGFFDAGFSFNAKPGHRIVGYTIDFAGSYNTEYPGGVGMGVDGVGWGSYSTGSGSFVQQLHHADSTTPALRGSLEAMGGVDYVQVQIGTELIQVGSEWQQDPGCVGEPDCQLIEVPIFEEVPIYMYQGDLGAAELYLQSITFNAITAPVPEPETYALLLAGGGLVGWARRRQMRAKRQAG
ncbi:PEP-CTERM sorting domain-containing protein [Chitinolyticbacter meiyuanensis]|uniref:PEP-CTERM sorting domain-containing protein n=1 Tax=Chitinolyticbacter meiyuanensis TaxID=682798 RepID=UPI001C9E504B|nr:PEP-CTERM sorting domain-containing protein [Chitinolyticbacter meiyuanensis]